MPTRTFTNDISRDHRDHRDQLAAGFEKHRGGSGGWARRERERDVDVIRIAARAPEAFFDELLAVVRALT